MRRRGQRRAAIEHAQHACAQYAKLEATPFLAHADELLIACGAPRTDRQTPSSSPSSASVRPSWAEPLTSQERAVALAVASGRTNQQAADELIISLKTIAFHLQNVYAKLGVHTRTELAALITNHVDDPVPLDRTVRR